jgi:hypothetical protein
VISSDQAAVDLETGGVKVMVPLSIVVTVGLGRTDMELRVAWALLMRPTSIEATKIPIRTRAIALVFIR